ncbi:homeobox-leucine zipper protein HDG9-like [Abrus precatorius]|uniref:Homeobox-leucine zipper protein HDG9-like n=1 Tax=Abrus precatorius TaxID=3816 RepID=A0A8B8K5E1_ABRPR|nr:homeobox-leucine zipper protein HDG9-like [Abrus precatorius]
MDFSMESSQGFNKDQDSQKFNEEKPSYNLTFDQQGQLEAFFERCPNPDETQRDQLAKELELEPKQIKYWFQNKRTETKMSLPASQAPTLEEVNQENNNCDSDQADATLNDNGICDPMSGSEESPEMEKAQILKVATAAMEELLRLTSEPFLWAKSSDDVGFVLIRERYAKMFPKVNDSLEGPDTHEESSRDSKIVRIGAMQLVEMFLDSDKWVNYFTPIVSKAETVEVLDAGSLTNRNGAMQVMYEEMHILSPLLPSRTFFFLRYCQVVGVGVWAIADVSLDSFGGHVPHCSARRLPSGCIIHQLPNGSSMVTWVEHVKVNDRMQTSPLYRDLLCNNIAYGAKRWLLALQRTCERFACTSSIENSPIHDAERAIMSIEGRKCVINLSNRMVQSFCKILKSRKQDSTPFLEENKNEIKVSIRMNTTPGQPHGFVATAITSISLPVPPHNIFRFLNSTKRRHKWDVLCCENRAAEIAYISIGGANAANHISFIQTLNARESNVLVFQESYIDSLGSYVVYAPIDVTNARRIVNGEGSMVHILPSGFLISGDGREVAETSNGGNANRSRGSLLTIGYQILISSKPKTRHQNMETMELTSRLVISIVEKIKNALKCSD